MLVVDHSPAGLVVVLHSPAGLGVEGSIAVGAVVRIVVAVVGHIAGAGHSLHVISL